MCYNVYWRIIWRRITINSMTGYGRATREADGLKLTVELKSVNHRFLDLNFRMPRSFMFLEDEARKAIGCKLFRGHVDIYLTYKNMRADARKVTVDTNLLTAYMHATDDVAGLSDDRTLMNMLRFPDVVSISEAEEDLDALRALLLDTLLEALDDLCAMRAREGENMCRDLAFRADALEKIGHDIQERYPGTVKDYMERLRAGVAELIGQQIDEQRLVQEVSVMAERSAIDEELVRLSSHISQLRQYLVMQEPVGRKIDFLVQELNREVNTISSKSQDIEITRLAMDGKAEIEKLREQLQNVE